MQIIRAKRSCNRLRCREGCAPHRALVAIGGMRSGGPCGGPEECRGALTDLGQHTPARSRRQQRCAPHQIDPPSRHCPLVPRGGIVNARRPDHRTGRSEAESIDDAEHGASIIGAMVVRFDSRTDRGHVLQKNSARARTDSCGIHRHTSAVGSGRADRGHRRRDSPAGTGTQTRTRATASDGVNDPVRAPWGQVPGTVAGSFTPSFLQ